MDGEGATASRDPPLAIWLFFEAALAPALLGLERTRERPLGERLTLASDHALYGAVVAKRS